MLTVTPETTVAELGSFLAERKAIVSVLFYSAKCHLVMTVEERMLSGTGPDLVTALNDAIGKVRG